MSFKYYTKTIEELQQIAKVIADNFSGVIGCSEDTKNWSPPVAYEICNNLVLAGSNCSNLPDKFEQTDGILSFKFTSVANQPMKDIWKKVVNFDSSIYDLRKLLTVKVNSNLDIKSKLKVCINQSKDYESSLFEMLRFNEDFIYSEDYKRLCWIVLACFCIRYCIYDFSIGKSEQIDLESINSAFIDKVIENIQYEKYVLSKWETDGDYVHSPESVSQQLSILMKNCKQIKSFVLAYLK